MAMSIPPEPRIQNLSPDAPYHPLFSSGDADVVLRSKEGTLYRVPSFLLRNTCGHFRQLFAKVPSILTRSHSQPQSKSNTDFAVPIQVTECDHALQRFLSMICGLQVPVWTSLDDFEDVLTLAEMWDAPGPLSLMRSSATAPVFLRDPIRLYGLACRLKWDEERKIASMYTIGLPLLSEPYIAQLQHLPSKDVLELIILQRSRREQFKMLIDDEMAFNSGTAHHFLCAGCATEIDNTAWRALKLRMIYELDKRSLGDTLMEFMDEWPEALACWSARCPTKGCNRLYYDKAATMRGIRSCMGQLSATVD